MFQIYVYLLSYLTIYNYIILYKYICYAINVVVLLYTLFMLLSTTAARVAIVPGSSQQGLRGNAVDYDRG